MALRRCCLGFAVASLVMRADAAQPVVLGIVLPLRFISAVFTPILELRRWLVDIGKVFPVHALADAFLVRITRTPREAGSTGSTPRGTRRVGSDGSRRGTPPLQPAPERRLRRSFK